jgi:hypothetical protein
MQAGRPAGKHAGKLTNWWAGGLDGGGGG